MIAEMKRWRIVMRNDTNLSSSSTKDLCAVSMAIYMCEVPFTSLRATGRAYKWLIDSRSYTYSNNLNNQFICSKT